MENIYYVSDLFLNNTRNVYVCDKYGVVLDVWIESVVGNPTLQITKPYYFYSVRKMEFVSKNNINNKGMPVYLTTFEEVSEHINYNTMENNA